LSLRSLTSLYVCPCLCPFRKKSLIIRFSAIRSMKYSEWTRACRWKEIISAWDRMDKLFVSKQRTDSEACLFSSMPLISEPFWKIWEMSWGDSCEYDNADFCFFPRCCRNHVLSLSNKFEISNNTKYPNRRKDWRVWAWEKVRIQQFAIQDSIRLCSWRPIDIVRFSVQKHFWLLFGQWPSKFPACLEEISHRDRHVNQWVYPWGVRICKNRRLPGQRNREDMLPVYIVIWLFHQWQSRRYMASWLLKMQTRPSSRHILRQWHPVLMKRR
jgi:hypothetical protein